MCLRNVNFIIDSLYMSFEYLMFTFPLLLELLTIPVTVSPITREYEAVIGVNLVVNLLRAKIVDLQCILMLLC
jgi:hypothetical protein